MRMTMCGRGGYRAYINDQLICTDHLPEREQVIEVEAGKKYRLRVEYHNYGGDARIGLKAKSKHCDWGTSFFPFCRTLKILSFIFLLLV